MLTSLPSVAPDALAVKVPMSHAMMAVSIFRTATHSESVYISIHKHPLADINPFFFKVLVSGTRCISVYEQTSCSEKVGEIHNAGNGACSNVITGTNVQSFRCSPDNTCA